MVKREEYSFRKKMIIEIREHHTGNYGAPGKKRIKKKKPTEEQMRLVNAQNKAMRCRHRLLEYFTPGDCFGTWTYSVEIRNDPKIYDEDFTKLAAYMTKDEYTREEKKDGTLGKSRLKESSYNTSRNMPLKEPHVDKLT